MSESFLNSGVFGMVLIVMSMVAMIVTYICVAVWIYKDAKKRGRNAIIWLLVVLFMPNLIGVVLLYMLTGRAEKTNYCSDCNEKSDDNPSVCIKCGVSIQQTERSVSSLNKRWIYSIIGLVIAAMVLMLSGFLFFIFSTDDLVLPGEVSVGKIENKIGNRWDMRFRYSSETMAQTFDIQDAQSIEIDASCASGVMTIMVIVDQDIHVFSTTKDPFPARVDLSDTDKNTLTVRLINNDVNDGFFEVSFS